MNKTKSQILIDEEIKKLPAETRRAFASFDWGNKLNELGKKHGLHIDQLGELYTETALVMIGLVKSDDYLSQIEIRLNLDSEKASALVNDINEQIFKPIRDALKSFVKININKESIISGKTENLNQLKQEERAILEKTGIEINKTEEKSVETPIIERGDLLEKVENLPISIPINLPTRDNETKENAIDFVQDKLNASFKVPITKTEHSLENLTKEEEKEPIKNTDPYREIFD